MCRWLIIPLSMFIAACSIEYDVVGRFDSFNEVFRGDIDHNLALGVAEITLTGENSGVVCRGRSEVTYVPPFNLLGCAGQRGVARLTCSDNRIANANWTANSCTSGEGFGTDSEGNSFTFAFGSTGEETEREMARLRPQVENLPELPVYRPQEVRRERGFSTGSGFFVTDDGHMVTNFHVIEAAKEVSVVLFGGREIPATVMATDPENDIALLDIDIRSTPLRISTGVEASRGDEVLTLGYPLITIQGQEQRANFGRVNALTGTQGDPRFYQIDVPIQPGNSGGPLLDTHGHVIGVVTATLDQFITLRETGMLPQNVNYAVKSAHLVGLLDNLPTASAAMTTRRAGGRGAEMSQVVADSESSVALVIAR